MATKKTKEELTADKVRRAKARRAQAKARRAQNRANKVSMEAASGYKPIEEWDEEELARGRPRDIGGLFRGPAPAAISRAVHEEAIKRFTDLTQADMRGLIPKSLKLVEYILTNDDVDEKGKPCIPPSVRLDAAKWIVEHLVGKPRVPVDLDISAKLQGVLAHVLVQPGKEGMIPAVESAESDEDEDSVSWSE